MRLILGTPALQAHSTIKYAQWRGTIADFVAERTGVPPHDRGPRTVGHASLAISLSANEQWLEDPSLELSAVIDSAMRGLLAHWSTVSPRATP